MSLIVSTAVSIGAAAAIYATQVEVSNPTWNTVLVTVFSVILSIGLISLLYEALLRETSLGETLEMVRLEQSVWNSGLVEITHRHLLQWSRLLEGGTEIEAVLRDPRGIRDGQWHYIRLTAAERAVTIRLALPDVTSSYFPELAQSLGEEAADFAHDVERARDELIQVWDKDSPGFKKGSSLTMYECDVCPCVSVFRTGEYLIVLFDSSKENSEPVPVVVFNRARSSGQAKWLEREVSRFMDQAVPIEAKRV